MSFMLVRTTANASLLQALDNRFWPQHWSGTFEDVLPYLNHAFAFTARDLEAQLPQALAQDILPIYNQLCEPDPRKRGFPGQLLNKIALERYITKFDVIARKADIGRYRSI